MENLGRGTKPTGMTPSHGVARTSEFRQNQITMPRLQSRTQLSRSAPRRGEPSCWKTEAEAVAFVVCHALGLETGTGSSDYIQLYHGDANLLKESLEVVQRTSTVILGAISPKEAVSTPAMAEVLQ